MTVAAAAVKDPTAPLDYCLLYGQTKEAAQRFLQQQQQQLPCYQDRLLGVLANYQRDWVEEQEGEHCKEEGEHCKEW